MSIRRTFSLALVLSALLLVAVPPVRAQHGAQPLHGHFEDAERWAQVFDDPARDAWQKPAEVIRALALPPDAAVADIGAGTGYFSVRLARAEPHGRVYGADIEPDMVRHVTERARRDHLPNLVGHLARTDDAQLPAPVDLALLVDVYHHIPHRAAYFGRLAGSLKPGGRVAIIDFRPDAPTGPPPSARVAPDEVKAELAKAGFRVVGEHGFLPYQYFLVFARSGP
ncbi:MAG: class I SAM-dependent methyltransferase [Burkholderiales bacterium]|nr:class I SAM-dependent methyltransferase [Burkholderiales bacterium]